MTSLLRLCTAGSVDDGKSTLIGRLLVDSRAVAQDQVGAVRAASAAGELDYAYFTDGLRAEREQGITIDVAYRYFSTARRRFILADTPGHAQYTRNMATGASTSDLAVLLVDARFGVRDQTRRHLQIARLLGVRALVLAVNKMDLVDFDEAVFSSIRAAFDAIAGDTPSVAIPLSATLGDNVVDRSGRCAWYRGPSLLEHLEQVDVSPARAAEPFRFPVQAVIRGLADFRGYAGQVVSGGVAVGDEVSVWPSGETARVSRVVTWDGDRRAAVAPMSVTVVLDRPVDAGRGRLLASGALPVTRRVSADVVWMDERPLDPDRQYLLKHGTSTVAAAADRALALNDIGRVGISIGSDLAVDCYHEVRATGRFVLIDPLTNATVGAGMIAQAGPDEVPA